MNLEEKIKKNIEEKNLRPKSKWNFIFKEWFIWVLGILSVLIGSFIISIILFVLANVHWGLYSMTNESFLDFVFEFLPFVWIIIFTLFVFVTYKFLRNTKRGYKYNFTFLLLGVLIATFLFGFISFNRGLGFMLENGLFNKMPFYQNILTKQHLAWDDDSKGLFLGLIVENNGDYFLENEHDSWKIDVTDLPEHFSYFFDMDDDDDDLVRIVGSKIDENTIYPCFIFPFGVNEREFFGNGYLEIKNEINPSEMRINNCRGVRPYIKLIRK